MLNNMGKADFNKIQDTREKAVNGYVASLKESMDGAVYPKLLAEQVKKLTDAAMKSFASNDLNVTDSISIFGRLNAQVAQEDENVGMIYRIVSENIIARMSEHFNRTHVGMLVDIVDEKQV